MRLLKETLYSERPLRVTSVARDLELSKGVVSKMFAILTRENIMKKINNEVVVQDTVATRGVKILLNLSELDLSVLREFPFVRGAGVYGSVVKGENTEESDIDLWLFVRMNVPDEQLAVLTNRLKRINEMIRPFYLTRTKIKRLKEEDEVFYYSLVFGSLTVYGEKIDTV